MAIATPANAFNIFPGWQLTLVRISRDVEAQLLAVLLH